MSSAVDGIRVNTYLRNGLAVETKDNATERLVAVLDIEVHLKDRQS